MTKYEVEWSGSKVKSAINHTIEAENGNDAFVKAVEDYTYPEYPFVKVWDGGCQIKHVDNPHYNESAESDDSVGAGNAKSIHSEQPAKSDGNVGWFENVEGSSLTEKQILLAQLAELRIIKRCVVGTVVIAIVIPFIVGGIISG